MRILRIEAEGIFLFEGKAVIDFNAEQRVYPDNAAMLYNPFGNTYTNNVLSFVGVNASGKTTTLKLISFVMSLLNAEAINTIDTKVYFSLRIMIYINPEMRRKSSFCF